jgi:hypothetical protein
MTAFSKAEQWDNDYDLYFVDKNGKIGLFCHDGWRLLPPSIAQSKENWQTVCDYFENLESNHQRYDVCPELDKHLNKNSVASIYQYTDYFGKISSKGLYCYDTYDFSRKERPYYRVSIPKVEFNFDDLPQEIKNILKDLRLAEISFAEDSIIPEKLVAEL